MEEIGLVDYAIIASGNRFRGEIAPAIGDLVEAGTIRVIDIAFVGKDADGNAVAMEVTEPDPDVQAGLEKMGIEVGGPRERGRPHGRGRRPGAELVGRADRVGERLGAEGHPGDAGCGRGAFAFERLPHEVVQAAREWALEHANA